MREDRRRILLEIDVDGIVDLASAKHYMLAILQGAFSIFGMPGIVTNINSRSSGDLVYSIFSQPCFPR